MVNGNDGRLQYTGLWVLNTKGPFGLLTSHTTITAGSQMSVVFNGDFLRPSVMSIFDSNMEL